MKSPIEGQPNLYKDTNSGVIVNRNSSDRERYQIAKKQARNALQSEQELRVLRKEMDEIKSLLYQLLNK